MRTLVLLERSEATLGGSMLVAFKTSSTQLRKGCLGHLPGRA